MQPDEPLPTDDAPERERPEKPHGRTERLLARERRRAEANRAIRDEKKTAAPEADRFTPVVDPTREVIFKGKRLNAFQVQAVDAIAAGRDVLVSAPTGAGKTLVAEYAIADAVKRGKRCIYTAPIKALSNQKYRDFRDDPEIDVGLMTGDVTIHPGGRVLIMTTEILRNAIFDAPEHLSDVEYVVFDEVHYVDDHERGSVWEESLIFAPKSMRLICLSATVSNADELGAWLSEIRGRETVVIQSSRRPVPLAHRFFTAKSGVFEPGDLDRVRKREALSDTVQKHKAHKQPRGRGRAHQEAPDARALFDFLQRRELLPALVFAFSRKDCERQALANAGRELLDAAELERMRVLQGELITLFQLDRAVEGGEIMSMARRGLGYHHAGMLPIHKELVERMFTSGLLKMLFTTETFALGINMPARTVVFQALRKFDGVTFDYLSTRDYMQMAGRAGRQGLDDEGLVYSLLSPKDLVEAPLKRYLAGLPEPVESRFGLSFSSILHLIERLGRERLVEAWEKSLNAFQHRRGTKKQVDANRREQGRSLDARVALLDELGYLDGDKLTSRGKIAKLINGFELQLTELCFGGLIENLPVDALAVVFVGLIYEERRRGEIGWVPSKLHGNVRTAVQKTMHQLVIKAAEHGVADQIKMPDWGLSQLAQAWVAGADFDAIVENAEVTPGDIVRTFRMAVQLMRQLRRAIDPEWDLSDRLLRAMEALNRDVVDARAQLELG
ncbi:MAG: DEAD/DEAH box helicase [Planctomycetota bacterium]|nr:DEAD/DEAH box helicase [Planctomycetota bacterium]